MKYDNASLPSGFLVKLNDAGIQLETIILDKTKRYTMTKKFYDFDNNNQLIKYRETWGISLEMPLNISTGEAVRLINNVIPKMQPSPFQDNKTFILYRYL